MRSYRSLLVIAFALLAVSVPAAAGAAQNYIDTISGYEYFATSTEGMFAGTAAGALPGYWNTDVRHTPLCVSCTPTATITGGSFQLATNLGGVTLVSGVFTGGTVQVTNAGANCTNQTFAVNGVLGHVGPWYRGQASGTFFAILTHYRQRIFGTCVIYAASVSGTLSLTF